MRKQSDSFIERPCATPGHHDPPTKAPDRETKEKQSPAQQLAQEIRVGERWIIGIGLATLIINTVIALIYWQQLDEMKKATRAATASAEAARDAAKMSGNEFAVSQRPWVAVKIEFAGPLRFDSKAAIANINISLANSGRSPALHVLARASFINYFEFWDTKAKNVATSEIRKSCASAAQDSVVTGTGTTLFPEQHKTELWSLTMRPEKERPSSPEVIGCVTYMFPFSQERHQTMFWGLVVIATNTPNFFHFPGPTNNSVPARSLRLIPFNVFAD